MEPRPARLGAGTHGDAHAVPFHEFAGVRTHPEDAVPGAGRPHHRQGHAVAPPDSDPAGSPAHAHRHEGADHATRADAGAHPHVRAHTDSHADRDATPQQHADADLEAARARVTLPHASAQAVAPR